MGKFFSIIDGKVEDWSYRRQSESVYVFYIGDRIIGQLFRHSHYWSAVCYGQCRMTSAKGFKNRYLASQFMIDSMGILDNEYQLHDAYVCKYCSHVYLDTLPKECVCGRGKMSDMRPARLSIRIDPLSGVDVEGG